MSENKKYYYLKLKETFFESEDLVILESMENGYLYSNILLKLYLKSLKNNGCLMFKEHIPYDVPMLSKILRHNPDVIRAALQVFKQLGFIEVLTNGSIYMLDIENFIGEGSTEAERKAKYRKKIKEQQKFLESGTMSPDSSESCPPEIEIDSELELESESDTDTKDDVPYDDIRNLFNSICKSMPEITVLTKERKELIKARYKQYGLDKIKDCFEKAQKSDFLSGRLRNEKSTWSCSFDWMMQEAAFVKIIEDTYKNRSKVGSGEYSSYDDVDWGKFYANLQMTAAK